MSSQNIANRAAFENAMSLDIAMGGSTNTILHLLAAAQEAELDFTMADIDALLAMCLSCAKLLPAHRCITWKTFTERVVYWPFWVSLRDRANCTLTATPCTAQHWRAIAHWDIAITDNAVALERFKAGPRASRRRKHLVRQRVGQHSI